ncbi:uncharacterized protein [Triticum aestivum]|uniref:uncharacterized protein isoform X2 n=1 Tax=Triticum aestivum TaxID=4565 RepID=UPI001D00AD47|nr:uncharacterized protein LOC123149194 isoform X2 [Triticum aestivum]
MATLLRTLQTAPSSLRPLTIKMLLDSFFEDTERYPLIIDGMPVSSAWSETNHSAWITARSTYMMALGPLMYTSGLMAVKTPRMLGRSSQHIFFIINTFGYSIAVMFTSYLLTHFLLTNSEGMYVRVVGRATSLEQFFQIKAYMVRTVKNFNDITHHFIYCIKAHINISKQSRLKLQENSVWPTPVQHQPSMPRYQIAPSQIPEDCSFEEKIFSILR